MRDNNEITRARLKALLPNMKSAWNVEHVELGPASIIVYANSDHVLRFPDQLLAFPVEVRILGANTMEMAA